MSDENWIEWNEDGSPKTKFWVCETTTLTRTIYHLPDGSHVVVKGPARFPIAVDIGGRMYKSVSVWTDPCCEDFGVGESDLHIRLEEIPTAATHDRQALLRVANRLGLRTEFSASLLRVAFAHRIAYEAKQAWKKMIEKGLQSREGHRMRSEARKRSARVQSTHRRLLSRLKSRMLPEDRP